MRGVRGRRQLFRIEAAAHAASLEEIRHQDAEDAKQEQRALLLPVLCLWFPESASTEKKPFDGARVRPKGCRSPSNTR